MYVQTTSSSSATISSAKFYLYRPITLPTLPPASAQSWRRGIWAKG